VSEMNKDNQVDVFIIGSGKYEMICVSNLILLFFFKGLSGLYAALLFSKIGLSIHIIDNNNHEDESDEILLLAPRCIQLLNQLDLLDLLLEKGTRHWKLDIYSQGILVESLKSFESNNPFNYSLSIQKSVVCDALKKHLASLDIFTQPEELIKIQEEGHYKLVYLKNNQVWKSQVILIENDVTNIVRQSLGNNII
jgi:2-polyprenyl-6-methoxyphenol hydroxylase-like FAD-dependent oxidoreductase